jgi:SEFIR domain-containing protein
MASDPPIVLISYSHDSAEHEQRVLALANELRTQGGVDARIDRYRPDPDEGWISWMRDHIVLADRVLLVFTETYARRFLGKEAPGKGLGVTFEGVIISQALYESGIHNAKFRPVRKMRALFRLSCGGLTVTESVPRKVTKNCYGGCTANRKLRSLRLV